MNSDSKSCMQMLLEGRREIDALDAKLLRLINQRAAIASQLAVIKKALGRGAYDADRERMVLRHICEENDGPLGQAGIANIFGSIITECRNVQETSLG